MSAEPISGDLAGLFARSDRFLARRPEMLHPNPTRPHRAPGLFHCQPRERSGQRTSSSRPTSPSRARPSRGSSRRVLRSSRGGPRKGSPGWRSRSASRRVGRPPRSGSSPLSMHGPSSSSAWKMAHGGSRTACACSSGTLPLHPNLHLATDWSRLGQGAEVEIDAWLNEKPDAALVVIDTYRRLRPPAGRGEDRYALDYHHAGALKDLADRHQVALLLLHHTRKPTAATTRSTTCWARPASPAPPTRCSSCRAKWEGGCRPVSARPRPPRSRARPYPRSRNRAMEPPR